MVAGCALCFLAFLPGATPLRAELPPEAQAEVAQGILAAKKQEWLAAIQSFQAARNSAPNAPEIYYYLGLAESKLPGRELRAICWFAAYLTAQPKTPKAAAVQDEIAALYATNQGNVSRLIQSLQDMTGQIHLMQVPRTDIVWLYVKSGDFAAALKSANLLQDSYWRCNELETIAGFQIKAGDFAGAKKTVAAALQVAGQIQDQGQKNLQLSGLAEVQTNAGDLAGALGTADQNQDPTYRVSNLSLIAKAQAQAGDIVGANQTLGTVLTAVEEIRSEADRSLALGNCVAALNLIAAAQLKTDEVAAAQATLATAKGKAGLIPDAADKGKLMALIETAHAKVEKIVLAQEGANQLATVLTHCRAGDFAAALQTTAPIRDEGAKFTGHLFVAGAQTLAGDLAGAHTTADLVTESARENLLTFCAMIRLEKDKTKATEYYDQVVAGDLGLVQREVIYYQLAAGDIPGAKKTAGLIQDAGEKDRAQESITQAAAASDAAPASGTRLTSLDWVSKISADDTSDTPLSTAPFLDLAGYLRGLPSSDDPVTLFDALDRTAQKLVVAQTVIGEMLKPQTGPSSAP